MKNKVIFAAAGNGKTYNLCNEAMSIAQKSKKYVLLVSYTNEGISAIEKEYKKWNFGVIDYNVKIITWYSFLLQELIKPYQPFISLRKNVNRLEDYGAENSIKGILFLEDKKDTISKIKKDSWEYYIHQKSNLLKKDKVSQLAHVCLDELKDYVVTRLESIYSNIFFDEIQDCAGWDLEVLKELFKSKLSITCFGDYKQTTFRTNNSPKNKQYRDSKIRFFFERLNTKKKKECEVFYKNTTRRFNKEICNFINTIYRDKESEVTSEEAIDLEILHTGVYIIETEYLEEYCRCYNPTIMRYNKKSKINFKHNCRIFNYGASKGQTFDRVVIIPVSTVNEFIYKGTEIKTLQTRSKFYVACTRPRYSIVFAVNKVQDTSLFQKSVMEILGKKIPVYKYSLKEEIL
ncbi:hypothetical protein EPT53_04340 [Fusobacterium necrophorum]|uniref:(+)RNA virus helicase C-terminal domain-containing protein n=1 Tax=Fusobacterium necrophorum TaxID=859 RepID=A0A4Q2KX24_9FUSO|nr:AAA family ATPase [Fusobacterium necrophorum]RXZ70184.1 hypothetical protein EPT53_04340 [Fusobacterium necrophorum]